MKQLLALGPIILFAIAIRLIGGRLTNKVKRTVARPAGEGGPGGAVTA